MVKVDGTGEGASEDEGTAEVASALEFEGKVTDGIHALFERRVPSALAGGGAVTTDGCSSSRQ
ncbi:hypothetical protein [Streptomyces sp. NPDC055134]